MVRKSPFVDRSIIYIVRFLLLFFYGFVRKQKFDLSCLPEESCFCLIVLMSYKFIIIKKIWTAILPTFVKVISFDQAPSNYLKKKYRKKSRKNPCCSEFIGPHGTPCSNALTRTRTWTWGIALGRTRSSPSSICGSSR